jgi:hypothetical protein
MDYFSVATVETTERSTLHYSGPLELHKTGFSNTHEVFTLR